MVEVRQDAAHKLAKILDDLREDAATPPRGEAFSTFSGKKPTSGHYTNHELMRIVHWAERQCNDTLKAVARKLEKTETFRRTW
jgi:hypothetical protein